MKELSKELSKKENILLPSTVILQKIISNEKLVIPRLKVFEEICPEIINWILMCYALEENRILFNIIIYKLKRCIYLNYNK